MHVSTIRPLQCTSTHTVPSDSPSLPRPLTPPGASPRGAGGMLCAPGRGDATRQAPLLRVHTRARHLKEELECIASLAEPFVSERPSYLHTQKSVLTGGEDRAALFMSDFPAQ